MAKVYYFGTDGKRYGPVTEIEAQAWYASGYFSSDVKFQVTAADRGDQNGIMHTLGELIELNGKILPFYFAPEKESREGAQDATLQQLVQDVEALRVSYQDAPRRDDSEDKETIALLQSQVQSLVESQTDMLRQISALSTQKENSPVDAQLEKRVSELKKRVDEQEKNYSSMRKELSATVSRCDRNDSRLERLLEKQQEVEGTLAGYDKRIGDIKASEKAIRESLSSCEQNAVASAERLKSIDSELSEVRREIEKEKEVSREHSDAIMKTVASCDQIVGLVHDSVERIRVVEQGEASLREEIKAVREASERATQMQSAMVAASTPFEEKRDESVPPWEKPDKKVTVVPDASARVEVKSAKSESSMQKSAEKTTVDAAMKKSTPWDETKVDAAEKEEEGSPWENAKTPVDAKTKKTSAAVKNSAPWDSDETNGDAEAERKKENRAPWDDDKSQPQPEPWNQTSGTNKTDSVGAKPTEKGRSIDQKAVEAPAKVEAVTAAVKPVSRAKDWNAICRDLDSDEEEGEADKSSGGAAMTKSLQACENFARDFIETLKVHCAAMESGDYSILWEWSAKCPFDPMLVFTERLTPATFGYSHIRDALRKELRRLADQTVLCAACDFVATTPYHLYQHLISLEHHENRTEVMSAFSDELEKMNSLVVLVFFKCVCPQTQQMAWAKADISLVEQAGARAVRSGVVATSLHPTQAFQVEVVARLTSFKAAGLVDGMPVEMVRGEDVRAHHKERLAEIRAWLACKKRRRQLKADFDKHMAEGAAGCGACYLQFASVDEYFQHVVSYGHAIRDQSLFAQCMWAWKGSARWDAAMV